MVFLLEQPKQTKTGIDVAETTLKLGVQEHKSIWLWGSQIG